MQFNLLDMALAVVLNTLVVSYFCKHGWPRLSKKSNVKVIMVSPFADTVKSSADKFVKLVLKEAEKPEFCNIIKYEGFPAAKNLMSNPNWRIYVLEQLAEHGEGLVYGSVFTGPCQLDSDWMFCTSCSKFGREQQLKLNDPI